ncbi:MAG: flagellar hook-length control protein FliK [Oscillospiraceae bacterium]
MQNMAVQMPMRKSQSTDTTQKSGKSARDKQAMEMADPFMQIIMSMIQNSEMNAQSSENAAATLSSGGIDVLSGLGGQEAIMALLQNSQSKMLEGLDPTAANTPLAFANALASFMAENQAAEANTAEASKLIAQFAEMTGLSVKEVQTLKDNLPMVSVQAANASATPKDGLQAAGTTKVGAEATDGISAVGQREYAGAIEKAKDLLSQMQEQPKKRGEADTEIDVDKLQSEVSRSTTPFELRFKTVKEGGAEPKLLDQLSTGIKQSLALGKNEFVLKLKPEALGEITVKLVEEAGKTTLSITTASAHTAKLLNGELAALREAVAPMHVEVNEVVTRTGETPNGEMQQFDMSGQQFADRQFEGQQALLRMLHNQNQSLNDDTQYTDDISALAQKAAAQRITSNELDAYI